MFAMNLKKYMGRPILLQQNYKINDIPYSLKHLQKNLAAFDFHMFVKNLPPLSRTSTRHFI